MTGDEFEITFDTLETKTGHKMTAGLKKSLTQMMAEGGLVALDHRIADARQASAPPDGWKIINHGDPKVALTVLYALDKAKKEMTKPGRKATITFTKVDEFLGTFSIIALQREEIDQAKAILETMFRVETRDDASSAQRSFTDRGSYHGWYLHKK